MARVGAIEGFVAERKISDDITFDRRLEQRPLKPGRIAKMTALDLSVDADSQPSENVATKSFDERKAARRFAWKFAWFGLRRTARQSVEKLIDEMQTLFDFAEADPDARINVALGAYRHFISEFLVRRIAWNPPRVERAARGAANESAGAILARERRIDDAGSNRAVEQGGGVVVKRYEGGDAPTQFGDEIA